MLRVVSLVASLTIVSKILGLVRDLVVAQYFGTSMMADAFNLAYLLTGNVFIIFGGVGGPFYSAMVAKLPKLMDKPSLVWNFVRDLVLRGFFILSFVALGLYFFKAQILSLFIPHADKPEYFDLTLVNIDILLPLIVICGPIGIISAVLNCYKKYFEPSLSPAVVNIIMIAAIFIMGDSLSGLALAIGTSIGGVLSLVYQVPSLMRIKSKIGTLETQEQEELKKQKHDYYSILYPAIMSSIFAQLIVFVDGFFCRDLPEGSWTAIVMANRIMQMPLGVLLTAFLVPLYPRITDMVHQNNIAEVKRLLYKSLKFLTLIIIPGIAIGATFAEPLIRIVFERGAFTAESTAMVSSAFFYLSFSALSFTVRDSCTRTLYSFGDSTTALYLIILATVLKAVLNYFLVPSMGLDGIALATSIVSYFNAGVLFFITRRLLNTGR